MNGQDMNNRSHTCDVAVIGGGAAGLSAAVTLARSRRSVIVVDAERPRNAPAAGVHNFLTRDGISATELTAVGRDELTSYGGTVIFGSAVAAERTDTSFAVDLTDGQRVTARKLLVATGLADTLPEIAGLRERWGREVLHCPYCHGWEVRDQSIGVLGTGPGAVHQALMFRQFSEDVSLLLHTAPEPTESQREALAARGISVVEGHVTDVLVDNDRMTGVRLGSGDTLALQALVIAPLFFAHCKLLESLGLHPAEQRAGEALLGAVFAADSSGATQVPGVWVAGNVTDMYAGVINSAAAGFTAAAAINASLLDEDVRRSVAERRTAAANSDPYPTALTAPDAFSASPLADASESFWEPHYQKTIRPWSGLPNAVLADIAADLTPASVLDIGCGEGGDALWLAGKGWMVTAIDVSATVLERARTRAAEHGLTANVAFVKSDVSQSFPDRSFDLVSAQYFHTPIGIPREQVLRRAAATVAVQGVLLIVDHASTAPWSWNQDPDTRFPTPQDTLATLGLDDDHWQPIRVEAAQRAASGPDGQTATVTDNVIALRRVAR